MPEPGKNPFGSSIGVQDMIGEQGAGIVRTAMFDLTKTVAKPFFIQSDATLKYDQETTHRQTNQKGEHRTWIIPIQVLSKSQESSNLTLPPPSRRPEPGVPRGLRSHYKPALHDQDRGKTPISVQQNGSNRSIQDKCGCSTIRKCQFALQAGLCHQKNKCV